MKSPKVSVVVPIYNAENFIQDTLDMLCCSTLEDIEILAINDGSTDNTLSILENCSQKDSRIKVIDKPNGGIYDARNLGLDEARGNYICFCDQDDIVDDGMYEKMYQRAQDTKSDLVVCSTGRYTRGKKIPFWIVKDFLFENNEVIEECFLPTIFNKSNLYQSKENIKFSETIWKCMISRSFIESNDLRFRSFVSYEDDRLFILDVLARAKKVSLISDVLYYWTVNEGSASHDQKYIEDLYNKDVKLEDETIKIMEISGCEKHYIQMFKNFNGAFRYTRLIENEVFHTSVSVKERVIYIKNIYQEKSFKENIKERCHFPKDMSARRIICCFLRIKMVRGAFYFSKVYFWVKNRMEDKPIWINLQKIFKENI